MRALPLTLGLSMVATGLLGVLALEGVPADRAVPVAEVGRAPLGSRLVVRGLLERVRETGAAASLATLTDCAGERVHVFFPRGASPVWSFTLVTLEATVKEYRGERELVVDDPSALRLDQRGALAVTPDELGRLWREMLCREVGFTGNVLWARVALDEANDVEVAIAAPTDELLVRIHLQDFPALRVQPGAAVTFLGTVAAQDDGARPVVHVRA